MTVEETFDYPEAARLIGVPEDWLRKRIGALPHLKFGRTVGFTADHITAIRKAHERIPAEYAPAKPLGRRKP